MPTLRTALIPTVVLTLGACAAPTNHLTALGSPAPARASRAASAARTSGVIVRVKTEQLADAHVHLRIGESLTVEANQRMFDWVGGDDYFSEVLSTNDPCITTCSDARRTFTATRV